MKIYFATATDYNAAEQIKAFRRYNDARAWLRRMWDDYELNKKPEEMDFSLSTNIQEWNVYDKSSCEIVTHHG